MRFVLKDNAFWHIAAHNGTCVLNELGGCDTKQATRGYDNFHETLELKWWGSCAE